MKYKTEIDSPLGTLTVASDGEAITGLWMEGQKFFCVGLSEEARCGDDLPVIRDAKELLNRYFQGKPTDFSLLPVRPEGTGFQKAVWSLLRHIPDKETRTYGQLAAALEATTGRRTSPRAVGSAVGRNPISILIPCHRVVGANGTLTGYAGGLERKEFLMKLEKENGTAL